MKKKEDKLSELTRDYLMGWRGLHPRQKYPNPTYIKHTETQQGEGKTPTRPHKTSLKLIKGMARTR